MAPTVSEGLKDSSLDLNRDKIVEELARPFVKLVMALVVLSVLNFVFGLLPGFGNTLGETSIKLSSLASGVLTVVAVLLVANFGRELEPRLKRVMDVSEELDDLATLVKHIIYLIAVSIAYEGLVGVVVPLIGNSWMYELAFLVIALVPTGLIAFDLYRNFEDFTDFFTRKIQEQLMSSVDEEDGGEEGEGDE